MLEVHRITSNFGHARHTLEFKTRDIQQGPYDRLDLHLVQGSADLGRDCLSQIAAKRKRRDLYPENLLLMSGVLAQQI